MTETEKTCNQAALKLKGGLYTLTTLQVLDTDLAALDQQIQDKVKQAPNFFKQAPIVLDLQFLPPNSQIDLIGIKATLEKNHLILVALRHAPTKILDLASKANLPILRDKDIDRAMAKTTRNTQQKTPLNPPVNNNTLKSPDTMPSTLQTARFVRDPVRSGQQIYARGSDLVITAPVSQGAEILADGHIHVYAPLRGRALAGISGNENAQIFCSSLEAELVSIAGHYKVSEDFEKNYWKQSTVISLQAGNLHILTL